MLTKHGLDGERLNAVVHARARAVGVDVVNVVEAKARVGECQTDARRCPPAFGVRVGDPIGIGGRAVADQLAMDVGAAPLRVLQFLQHHHGRPLAEHEAVAVVVKRPAGPSGFFVAGGEGREQVEPGDAEGMDHAVRAAGEHDVGLTPADNLGSLPDRLARSCAGCEAVEVGPLCIEQSREVAGGHVRLLLYLRERMKRLQSFFRELRHVEHVARDRRIHHAGEGVEVLLPFAAAQVDAQPRRIGGQAVRQAGILHRLERGPRREFRVTPAEPPTGRVLALVADVPVANLGRDLGRESRGVKHRRQAHARRPHHQVFPEWLHAQAKRRNAAHARDHHPAPAGHHRHPPLTTGVCRDHHSGRTRGLPASSRPTS